MQFILFFFVPEAQGVYSMSTKEVLNGWMEYLKLAVPSVLCSLILYTPAEIAILLAGTIDPN